MVQPFLAMGVTIRNLTATPIELKVWERFKDGAETFDRHDLSVPVGSYSSVETPFEAPARGAPEATRMTFQVRDQHYRLDLPTPLNGSITLASLSETPQTEITAIYLPETSFLALYASAHLDSWMQPLRPELSLAALSIPGTHNSPTCHRALPSVRCQAVPPRAQLANGVRFFDVRVQPERPADPAHEGLILVHSAFPISLTGAKYFRALVDETLAFLNAHRGETVVMSVKREGTGTSTDHDLAGILRRHYVSRASDRWFTDARVPTLGDARGKIILLRRFGTPEGFEQGFGIDGSAWADNTPNATCPSGHLCVQDFYEVAETQNVGKKLLYAQEHLARAAGVPPGGGSEARPLYVNFLSASNFWSMGLWPEKIAAKINPGIVEYLCRIHGAEEGGSGGTGIVVCDWVGNAGDWDLVRCVVGMNARLMT